MRILILTQYYSPEPIFRPVELAEGLRDLGHQVGVVTGFPHYPIGSLYPGYRTKPWLVEVMNGIEIRRSYEWPYHGPSARRRLLNYGSFMCSAPLAGIRGQWDVMFVRHPPLTIGVAAWMIGRLKNIPYVYDVEDIWPESAVEAGMMQPSLALSMAGRLETFVYSRASHINVVTDEARQNLTRKGVPSEKISVLPRWVDDRMLAQDSESDRTTRRRQLGWDGKFVVVFAGNVGTVQSLDVVIDAAAFVETRRDIVFVIVGEGVERARLEARARDARVESQVVFLGGRPSAEALALMAAADALLVHLKNSALAEYVIPAKLFASMASGRPVIAALRGEAARLVSRSGSGVVIPPEDSSALAQCACRLAELSEQRRLEMGSNGRRYIEDFHTRSRVLPQYAELLEQVAARTVWTGRQRNGQSTHS